MQRERSDRKGRQRAPARRAANDANDDNDDEGADDDEGDDVVDRAVVGGGLHLSTPGPCLLTVKA
jgi:hypothetical protein